MGINATSGVAAASSVVTGSPTGGIGGPRQFYFILNEKGGAALT